MQKITIVDANNWFRRYMLSERFLSVDGMITELASLNPTFLVWDGFNGNAKRRAIYQDYKKSRKARDADTDFETLNLIRDDLKPWLPAPSVSADGFEGDDVVNYLAKMLASKDSEIEIISTDKDLAAIDVKNISNPQVSEKFLQTVGERRWIPLYKTLVGDPSDSISGLKGFGAKAWESLSPWTRDKLCLYFSLGNPDVFEAIEPEEKVLGKIRENFEKLKPMWDIVNFLPVDPSEVKFEPADYNPEKIIEILKQKGVLV